MWKYETLELLTPRERNEQWLCSVIMSTRTRKRALVGTPLVRGSYENVHLASVRHLACMVIEERETRVESCFLQERFLTPNHLLNGARYRSRVCILHAYFRYERWMAVIIPGWNRLWFGTNAERKGCDSFWIISRLEIFASSYCQWQVGLRVNLWRKKRKGSGIETNAWNVLNMLYFIQWKGRDTWNIFDSESSNSVSREKNREWLKNFRG